MLELAAALAAFEWVVLGYFLVLNTLYLVFSISAFFFLVAYTRRAWRGDVDALLAETAATLNVHYGDLEADFSDFFPRLCRAATTERERLLAHGGPVSAG